MAALQDKKKKGKTRPVTAVLEQKAGPTLSSSKRKATEDVPLATPKRRKAVKPAGADKLPDKNGNRKPNETTGKVERTNAVKPPKKPKAVESTESLEADHSDASDNSDGDLDEETRALVQTLDSGDEADAFEDESSYREGQDVGKVPQVTGRPKKSTKSSEKESGVMFISRIPRGFFEHEMRAYFSQFGPITNLRLSRNKKSGASKGYGFIEFGDASTCEIASRTMDGYLLFGHILKCKVIPKDQVPADLWKGANRRFKRVPWNKLAGRQLERPAAESTWTHRINKEERRRAERAQKLRDIGYEFEGPRLKATGEVARPEEGPQTSAPLAAAEEKPGIETVEDAGSNGQENGDGDDAAVLRKGAEETVVTNQTSEKPKRVRAASKPSKPSAPARKPSKRSKAKA